MDWNICCVIKQLSVFFYKTGNKERDFMKILLWLFTKVCAYWKYLFIICCYIVSDTNVKNCVTFLTQSKSFQDRTAIFGR